MKFMELIIRGKSLHRHTAAYRAFSTRRPAPKRHEKKASPPGTEVPTVFLHSLSNGQHNRPTTEPESISLLKKEGNTITTVPLETVMRRPVPDELHYMTVSTRLDQVTTVIDDGKKWALIEFKLGPIPITSFGKEIILKVGTPLNMKESAYGETNTEVVAKLRDWEIDAIRDWEIDAVEPPVGNYYPLNLDTYLDVKNIEVFVLLDPKIGGSAAEGADIKLKRHLHDMGSGLTIEGSFYYEINLGLKGRIFGIQDEISWLGSHLSTFSVPNGSHVPNKLLVVSLQVQNGETMVRLLPYARFYGDIDELIPYVGGVEHAHLLVPPLETLCTVDETCVSDKAVESLCRIGSQMRESDLVDWFIPLVERLAAGEWFTARVSACGLFHTAYQSAPDLLKAELRSIYSQLCQDDMPTVRRAAATNLGKFAATVEAIHLKSDAISIFDDLTQDDQDSVRLLAVEGCAALGKLLEPQECVAHILPVIVNFSQYKSWRVRYMVANQLYELYEAVGPEPTRTDLVRLFRDNEAEVRIAAAGKVTKFCRILNPELDIQHILPCVKELSSDSSQHVRSALASVIMGMAPVLGKDATIEQLFPIFLSLLKDEVPDVRLNIISKLDQVNQVIGIDLLSQSLLPAIVELAENRHWRVRLAIIEYIPLLASQLGVGFFDDKLGALCMQWLQDKVYSMTIRDAAANNLKRLAEEFGPEWAMQHIVPQVLAMINNPHYLYRMTVLCAISLLARVMASEITCSKLLPVIVTASKDRVPNIKFNVAKVLQSMIPIVDQSVAEKSIRLILVELTEDPDVDVRFFANQALRLIDQVMMSS